ncbi:hypothetical protein M0Q50_10330 [bacterium]|jgi:hypothetical protein|nr:hypothetical protein [bacterium]
MSKEELVDFLKSNLKIKIKEVEHSSESSCVKNVYVQLLLNDEVISEESINDLSQSY